MVFIDLVYGVLCWLFCFDLLVLSLGVRLVVDLLGISFCFVYLLCYDVLLDVLVLALVVCWLGYLLLVDLRCGVVWLFI